jgi:hypothetical protein
VDDPLAAGLAAEAADRLQDGQVGLAGAVVFDALAAGDQRFVRCA